MLSYVRYILNNLGRVTTWLLISSATFLSVSARADVALPHIFGDHMVLQRDGTVPIWGTAAAGEAVTVTAGKVQGTATAGSDGKWMVKLAGLPASTTPIDVTVAGKNTITFHDVLVGDVWVCSGQSNMEFSEPMEASAKTELLQADHPLIRLFYVPKVPSRTPADEIGAAKKPLEGSWQVCSRDALMNDGDWNGFSAVGYTFGREVNAATQAPVGLISDCWGGQTAQSFTSLEALQANPMFKHYVDKALDFQSNYDKYVASYNAALPLYPPILEKWKQDNKAALDAYNQWPQKAKEAAANNQPVPPRPPFLRPPNPPQNPASNPAIPTVLYNGMIHPIIPYAIKGAIWYQGEANAGGPVEYRTLLPTMIQDWRTRWGQGDFPFLTVELANFMKRLPDPSESNWAALREAQAKTLSLPKTGLAVTIDIGEANDIHPKDKEDVGHRLAVAALNVAYGQKAVGSGPIYKSMTIEGDKVHLAFDSVGQGLVTDVPPPHFHPGEPRTVDASPEGFAVAGADHKFAWAQAAIEGDGVVVSSPAVPAPVAVRYAWADNPACNLYNKDGLPAVPFRTDDWPVGEQVPPPPKPVPAPAPAPAK
jgi:sialate O-acetylesterase